MAEYQTPVEVEGSGYVADDEHSEEEIQDEPMDTTPVASEGHVDDDEYSDEELQDEPMDTTPPP